MRRETPHLTQHYDLPFGHGYIITDYILWSRVKPAMLATGWTHEIFDPFVSLALRIDEEGPSLTVLHDDPVLHRKRVFRKT